MSAPLTRERLRLLIDSGEPVDVLVRQIEGPAQARDGVTMLALERDVVVFRTRDGRLERSRIEDVLDARLVRRRLSGGGPLAKIVDVFSWFR